MHRFYLPPVECDGSLLTLAGREAHHALHVLRLRRGEQVVVLDGAGHEYLGEIRELTRHEVQLMVVRKTFVPAPPWQITLLQAIPKGKIIESIIQKATELGVARVVPLLSERVVAHLDRDQAADKAEHWRGVAVEAIKQCGSPWLPQIELPVNPGAFLARGEKFDLPLIGSLLGDGRHPREWFNAFQNEHGRQPQSVAVWVGPEGDFTAEEVRAAESAGARPITLGRLVLRSETAAIYSLSVLNYELQADQPPSLK